ncbi:MAG: cation diffusion facilitator family transporter [Candidatus Faecalibacterium intestinavium]|uniref:Cation diffusion facilitator family transporter n=1 Tax=Candidatus Faecalibacterium intestinavium TaxID=2838580 RepID=A0A9E2NQR1_9FIRM|nr:cation diffusion facilitator family transporter [Candidatus Faecalibacterium intestinavium]
MTQLLIRLFVRNHEDVKNPAVRTAYGNFASLVGVVCNLILVLGKLAVGSLFGSIAIVADGLNNLSDASSSLVSLAGFRLAAKAPDEKHPYGHARYEYLAGLVVSAMIMAIGLSLLKDSVLKVFQPEPVGFSLLSVGVLVFSICLKFWMSRFNRTVGQAIQSETLIATAADSRNDVITTTAVLASTLLCKVTGLDIIDGLVGVGVAGFILFSGWGLVMNTLSPLLGESPDPELVERIEQKVLSYPGVLGVHDLMVHDYGPGQQFASLHIEFPAEVDPLDAHDLIDNIERDVRREEKILLTIHYDPIVTSDARVGVLRVRLNEKVRQIDPALSIHDLRIVPGTTHANVLFDLVLPAGYTGDRAGVIRQLREFVAQQDERYVCVIKVEQSYASTRRDK